MQGLHVTPVLARQEEVYFDLNYKEVGGGPIAVSNARAIHYVPAPRHARHNEELRFTFRNKVVFNQLIRGDVLEFRKSEDPGIWFEVTRLPVGSQQNVVRIRSGKKYGSL